MTEYDDVPRYRHMLVETLLELAQLMQQLDDDRAVDRYLQEGRTLLEDDDTDVAAALAREIEKLESDGN